MIPAGVILAVAALTLMLAGAVDAWHKLKRLPHATGCAVVRVVGKRCKEKPRASRSGEPVVKDYLTTETGNE